jgi:ComF family protein
MKQWLRDLSHILYPDLCVACDARPKVRPAMMCPDCLYVLPMTDHFTSRSNTVIRHFWGRVEVTHAAALYYMPHESIVHEMIHRLKYKDKTYIGTALGETIGQQIKTSTLFPPIDLIIPVPLAPRKMIARGYNQCSFIAKGVHDVIGGRVNDHLVQKIRETPSQTGLSRFERVQNVAGAFIVKDKSKIQGLHVLLVDDVITTGATLEAISMVLFESGASTVSIVAIGAAES